MKVRNLFLVSILFVYMPLIWAAKPPCLQSVDPRNPDAPRAAFEAGIKYFLLPIQSTELPRFIAELSNVVDENLPESHSSREAGLYPISRNFPMAWTRSPAFGIMEFPSDHLVDPREKSLGGPVLVHSLQQVYVKNRWADHHDGSFNIYNRWALETGKLNLFTNASNESEKQEIYDYFRAQAIEQISYQRVLGVVVMKSGIRRNHVLGFIAPPDEPELVRDLKKQIARGNIKGPLIESASLKTLDHALRFVRP